MKYFIKFLSSVFLILFFSHCCKPGLGGNATIEVYPFHHQYIIYGTVHHPDTVFVKYNAKDFPGGSLNNYDTYFIENSGSDHIQCKDLKCGDYYFYVCGFDSIHTHDRVIGGAQIKISHNDRKKEQNINFAVSEP